MLGGRCHQLHKNVFERNSLLAKHLNVGLGDGDVVHHNQPRELNNVVVPDGFQLFRGCQRMPLTQPVRQHQPGNNLGLNRACQNRFAGRSIVLFFRSFFSLKNDQSHRLFGRHFRRQARIQRAGLIPLQTVSRCSRDDPPPDGVARSLNRLSRKDSAQFTRRVSQSNRHFFACFSRSSFLTL